MWCRRIGLCLAPALSLLVGLAACRGRSGAAGDALQYLPEGSTGVAVMDVKKLLASPLFGQEPFKAQLAAARGDFQLLVEAGIDPFANVDTVALAGDPSTHRVVAVLSGSFDAAKAAQALGGKIRNTPAIKPQDQRVAVAAGAHVVVFGTREAVTSARAGKGLAGSPAVKELLGLVDRRGPVYGAVSIPPELARLDARLGSLKGLAGALDLSSGIGFTGVGHFGAPADALAIKTMLDGLLPMARGEVPEEVLAALEIDARGADVIVSLALPRDKLPTTGAAAEMLGEGLAEARRILAHIVRWLLQT